MKEKKTKINGNIVDYTFSLGFPIALYFTILLSIFISIANNKTIDFYFPLLFVGVMTIACFIDSWNTIKKVKHLLGNVHKTENGISVGNKEITNYKISPIHINKIFICNIRLLRIEEGNLKYYCLEKFKWKYLLSAGILYIKDKKENTINEIPDR